MDSRVVLSLPHINLWYDAHHQLVRATRTDTPISDAAVIDAMVRAVEWQLNALGRARLDLLVDLRQAPLRVETDFEAPMAALRLALTRGMRRSAFLVDSVVGFLQIRRFIREQRLEAQAFDSEVDALTYLAGGAARLGGRRGDPGEHR